MYKQIINNLNQLADTLTDTNPPQEIRTAILRNIKSIKAIIKKATS